MVVLVQIRLCAPLPLKVRKAVELQTPAEMENLTHPLTQEGSHTETPRCYFKSRHLLTSLYGIVWGKNVIFQIF